MLSTVRGAHGVDTDHDKYIAAVSKPKYTCMGYRGEQPTHYLSVMIHPYSSSISLSVLSVNWGVDIFRTIRSSDVSQPSRARRPVLTFGTFL
jgi:hypothetical protein